MEVYSVGVWEARRRSYVRFFEEVFETIWSRQSRGLEFCLLSPLREFLVVYTDGK